MPDVYHNGKLLVPVINPAFVEEPDDYSGFYEYSHHLREAAHPDGYNMGDEIIMSLVQWVEVTYGKEAMREAVAYATMEWDL